MREENNTHTHTLSFFILGRQALRHKITYSLSPPTHFLSHSKRHTFVQTRPQTHLHTLNSRKTNARHHPDFCTRTRTRTLSPTHAHTHSPNTLECLLSGERTGRLINLFLGPKKREGERRVVAEVWERGYARAATRPKSQQVATWLANARQEVHRRCSHRRHAADP